MLSKVDGRQNLVETTRLLSQQVASKQRRLEDITPSTVEEFIKGMSWWGTKLAVQIFFYDVHLVSC